MTELNKQQKILKEFLDSQIKAINEYKWIESQKAGKDLGDIAILQWTKDNAKLFRKTFCLKKLREAYEELQDINNIKNKDIKQIKEDCLEKIEDVMKLLEG